MTFTEQCPLQLESILNTNPKLILFNVIKIHHRYHIVSFATIKIYNRRVASIKNVIQLCRSCSVKYKKRRVIRLTKCIIVVTLLFTGGSCHERGVINHWGWGHQLAM